MSTFTTLFNKIVSAAASQAINVNGQPQEGVTPLPGVENQSVESAPQIAKPLPKNIDAARILDEMARNRSETLNWKTSIVDLMKLVGMDSSFSARKNLANELEFTGDTSDSAFMNTWLHKEVMKKISDNGGTVPREILH